MTITKKSFLILTVDFIVLVFMVYLKDMLQPNTDSIRCIACISLILLLLHLIQTKCLGIPIISVTSVFIILSHVFNLGYYYLKLFEKEDFFLFGDWFKYDLDTKVNSGMFSIIAVHCVVMGIVIAQDWNMQKSVYTTYEMDESNEAEIIAIRNVGIVLLFITLPCRLYWDYLMIRQSFISGGYVGGVESSGLVGDIQTLFVPAFLCYLYSLKNKKSFKLWVFSYVGICIVVMMLSGSRRYYVTGIIIIAIFYLKEYKANKKKNFFKYLLIAYGGIILLNLMTYIRNSRLASSNDAFSISLLFSLDFLWETFSEFGITGNVSYYACKYFPSLSKFLFGQTYLGAIVYILPIGWLISLKASVGSIIYALSHNAVGGSYIGDLFANWGWFSIPFAILTGLLIGSICNEVDERSDIKSVVLKYAVGYFVINYVRSSTLEILRGSVYTIILITVLYKFVFLHKNNIEGD